MYIQVIAQEGVESSNPIVPPPNVILPSPQSLAFEKYINHAITEYNGLPEISIPLYEIEIKGLKIPVCLNYHASGIQYWQNDGEIGAGWSLSVGGYRIIRRINGKDDFIHDYYSNDSLSIYSGNQYDFDRYLEQIKLKRHNLLSLPMFEDMPSKYIDGEYDLFTYMTPSTSGHFIITERNLTTRTYIAKNLEHKLDTILFFADNIPFPTYTLAGELIDENGFRYHFGNTNKDGHFALEGYWDHEGDGSATGWLLKTIQSPYGDSVQFDYKQYYCISPRFDGFTTNALTYTEAYCMYPYPPTGDIPPPPPSTGRKDLTSALLSKNTTWAQYVMSITGVNENIEFIREKKDSAANTGNLLKEILIRSKDGQLIKKITLVQDIMFTKGSTVQENGEEPWHYILRSVKIGDGTAIEKEYTLDYHRPQGRGASPDYWNYYAFNRRNVGQELFIPTGLKNVEVNVNLVFQNGCMFNRKTIGSINGMNKFFINRSVDEINQKSFSLKRITFPTGGYTEYEYEPNSNQQDVGAPGQRVKKIISCANPNLPATVTLFEYGSGYGKKMYDEFFMVDQSHTTIVPYQVGMLAILYLKLKNHAKIFSNNMSRGNIPADAFNVQYSKVTTRQLNGENQITSNGKIVSTYDIERNYLADQEYLVEHKAGGKPLLRNRKIYDAKDTLLQEEDYSYELTKTEVYNNMYVDRYLYFNYEKNDRLTPRNPTVNDYDTYPYLHTDFGSHSGFYFYNDYNISTGRYLPVSKITTLYTGNSNVVRTENYTYNSRNQLTKTSETTSQGATLEKELSYPANGSWLIAKHNMYNAIQQEITKYNNQETKRIRYNYPNSSLRRPLPESVDYSSTGEDNFTREMDYLYDQSNGNLIQHTGRSGLPVSYLWGYNNQYPIAKVVGATYEELAAVIGTTSIQNRRVYSELNPVFTRLRNGLPQAQVYGYIYKPLVGITAEVGSDGLTTHYSYDNFGRLYQVLDNIKNIINQYQYHYKTSD
jgi:hypothetical protein